MIDDLRIDGFIDEWDTVSLFDHCSID